MTRIIGIDLGTTNSALAIWEGDRPRSLPDRDDPTQWLTPSAVAYDAARDEFAVGRAALELTVRGEAVAITSVKRLMGRRFDDWEIQEDLQAGRIPCPVRTSALDDAELLLDGRPLSPPEVSAKILEKLRRDAEAYLGTVVSRAVITVPAYFSEAQRQATREAGRGAGLEVVRILSEPIASCLAFGHTKLAEPRRAVAVYDLGGGTFDVSVVAMGRGPFRTCAINGDVHLGGDDLDWRIVAWAKDRLDPGARAALEADPAALVRLRRAAEQAKRDLSGAGINVAPIRWAVGDPPVSVELDLTRAMLEELASAMIERTLTLFDQALYDAHLTKRELADVLLVGGQTRMPLLRRRLAEHLGQEPRHDVDPDLAVALGAGVQAGILAGEAKGLNLADAIPRSLGIRLDNGRFDVVIPRNSPIPVRRTVSHLYSTSRDNQERVDVQVYQGEEAEADHNEFVGKLGLGGIEPARAGEPAIELEFAVDEGGILDVTARDLRTGNKVHVRLTGRVGIADEPPAPVEGY